MFLAILLLAQQAHALFQLKTGWTKLRLSSTDGLNATDVDQIAADSGGLVVWRYTNFTLIYVPNTQRESATSRANQMNMEVVAPDEMIHLPGATIDPAIGVPPEIDASQKIFSYPANQSGLYVVQFIGPALPEWGDEVRSAGATLVAFVREQTYLVAATPEQARRLADSPHIQFLDFLHPYLKGRNLSTLQTSVRYDVYVYAGATGTHSADADVAPVAEVIERRSVYGAQFVYKIRIKGEDVPRLARAPLTYGFQVDGVALPRVWAAMPRQAIAGSTIVISGEGFTEGAAVSFGGVPSRRVEVLGYDRLRVEVPRGTAEGPIDLLVTVPANKNQFFSGRSPSGFHAGPTTRDSFEVGDLITANFRVFPGVSIGPAVIWELRWLDPRDASLFAGHSYIRLQTTLFVDLQGRVIFVDEAAATQYEPMSAASTAGPSFAIGATAVLFDRAGEAIVVRGNTIERRGATGSLIASGSIPPPGSFARIRGADLAADQCTLYYTIAKTVAAYDVCAFQPLPAIFTAAQNLASLRILPDATMLVGDEYITRLLSPSGTTLAVFEGGGPTAVAPDGSFAWIDGYDGLRRYDLLRRVVSSPAKSGLPSATSTSLVVYGGWYAARDNTATIPPPEPPPTQPPPPPPSRRRATHG